MLQNKFTINKDFLKYQKHKALSKNTYLIRLCGLRWYTLNRLSKINTYIEEREKIPQAYKCQGN